MNINTVSLFNLKSTKIEFSACESTVKIKTPSHDEGFGLIVKNNNSSSADVIIKGGNSVMAMGDNIVTVEAGCETLVSLKDTGRFKNVHGENAGYIVLEIENVSPENIEVFAFGL